MEVQPSTTSDQGKYCVRCGQSHSSGAHAGCAAALELEPPRYCRHCGRRMVVQVTPGGWRGRCVEHGTLTAT